MVMSNNIVDKENAKFSEVNSLTSVNTNLLNQLVSEKFDYIELSYTGTDLTKVIYKSGGVSGTIVATLTLAYSGGNLINIGKT